MIDYLNYVLLEFIAGLTIIFLLLMILSLLCTWPQIQRRRREEEEVRRRQNARPLTAQQIQEITVRFIIQKLTKYKFDKVRFRFLTECIICAAEFKEGSEVTPLCCNVKHYFHYACIVEWLRKKQECPLCRHDICAEELDVFKLSVDRLLLE